MRLVLAGVPVIRSLEFSNQAIDSNEKSDSEVERHQRHKYEFRHCDAYYFHFRQNNNRAGETGKRKRDARDN
jgi:hypothetical protein